jgi:hypothetical protein
MTMSRKVAKCTMVFALAAMTWTGFVQEGKASMSPDWDTWDLWDSGTNSKATTGFGNEKFTKWTNDNCNFKNGVMECNKTKDYRDDSSDINFTYDSGSEDIKYYSSYETYNPYDSKVNLFDNILDLDIYNHTKYGINPIDLSGFTPAYGNILNEHWNTTAYSNNLFKNIYYYSYDSDYSLDSKNNNQILIAFGDVAGDTVGVLPKIQPLGSNDWRTKMAQVIATGGDSTQNFDFRIKARCMLSVYGSKDRYNKDSNDDPCNNETDIGKPLTFNNLDAESGRTCRFDLVYGVITGRSCIKAGEQQPTQTDCYFDLGCMDQANRRGDKKFNVESLTRTEYSDRDKLRNFCVAYEGRGCGNPAS